MKWIVHLTVVLLNVLWVAFFLTDPLAVFVQKRSFMDSDEEMKVGEFCLQPPSDPSDVYAAPKTAAGEPPSTDLNEATTFTPTVQTSTSSEPTSVISSSTTETAPVPQTEIQDDSFCPAETRAKIPVKVPPFQDSVPRREERYHGSSFLHGIAPDRCCFQFYPRRLNKNVIVSYSFTDIRCKRPAVVLVTIKSRNICADPSLSWVQDIMEHIDKTSQ